MAPLLIWSKTARTQPLPVRPGGRRQRGAGRGLNPKCSKPGGGASHCTAGLGAVKAMALPKSRSGGPGGHPGPGERVTSGIAPRELPQPRVPFTARRVLRTRVRCAEQAQRRRRAPPGDGPGVGVGVGSMAVSLQRSFWSLKQMHLQVSPPPAAAWRPEAREGPPAPPGERVSPEQGPPVAWPCPPKPHRSQRLPRETRACASQTPRDL